VAWGKVDLSAAEASPGARPGVWPGDPGTTAW
jgi:hypothetical protein